MAAIPAFCLKARGSRFAKRLDFLVKGSVAVHALAKGFFCEVVESSLGCGQKATSWRRTGISKLDSVSQDSQNMPRKLQTLRITAGHGSRDSHQFAVFRLRTQKANRNTKGFGQLAKGNWEVSGDHRMYIITLKDFHAVLGLQTGIHLKATPLFRQASMVTSLPWGRPGDSPTVVQKSRRRDQNEATKKRTGSKTRKSLFKDFKNNQCPDRPWCNDD